MIAAQGHAGVKDKEGSGIYLHPLRMMLGLFSPDECFVAVLHDVCEDSRSLALCANVAALLSNMAEWKPPRREPPKTKAGLREMLTKAVRNTQPEPKPKHPPKGKSGRG
jgi:hypothetical protein